MRKLIAGLLALVLAALITPSCSNSDRMAGNSNQGRVQFVMRGPSGQASGVAAATGPITVNDGSGRQISSATITLSSILARNLNGQLVGVTIALPMDVDLVGLITGGTVDLPMGALPAATYDQLVVVIRALHVVLSDGTQIDVTPPGGGWTVVINTVPFDVVDGQVTTVQLHFQSNGAFQWVDGQLEFNPGFDCSVDHEHDGGDDHD